MATLPLFAVEAPLMDGSPRGTVCGSVLDTVFLGTLSLWTMDGAGGIVLGLGRFRARAPSEDDEPGRVLDVDVCCKSRLRDRGSSDEDCDNVRECLEACDVVSLKIDLYVCGV